MGIAGECSLRRRHSCASGGNMATRTLPLLHPAAWIVRQLGCRQEVLKRSGSARAVRGLQGRGRFEMKIRRAWIRVTAATAIATVGGNWAAAQSQYAPYPTTQPYS